MVQVVKQQAGEPVEQLLRRVFPAVFRKLSRDQFNDFCELARVYRDEQDDEVLETMVEILVPESLGEVVMQIYTATPAKKRSERKGVRNLVSRESHKGSDIFLPLKKYKFG